MKTFLLDGARIGTKDFNTTYFFLADISNVDDDNDEGDYYIMHNILHEKTANNKDMFTQQLQIPSRSLLGNIKNGSPAASVPHSLSSRCSES